MAVKLTPEQRQILRELANRKKYPEGDPWACANWVAEGCGHWYETHWAGSRLPGLARRGLIERGVTGWYRITPAGRAALEAQPTPDMEAR